MPATYDEAATLVQARQLADQIVRDLESTTLSRPIPYVAALAAPPPPVSRSMPSSTPSPVSSMSPVPPALEPEELLPPPPSLPPSNIYDASWSAPPLPIIAAPLMIQNQTRMPTVRRRKRRKAKSHLHWAVLAMAVMISLGLWRDPIARVNAKRQLTTETHRVVKTVSSKLAAVKAAAKSTAKHVEARLTTM